jgi:hypothetical protein
MRWKIFILPGLVTTMILPLFASPKQKVGNFVIGDKKFVVFQEVNIDDEKFKIDEEVAGNWNPEIGEAIRYYKIIRAYLSADSSVKVNDTLDLCKKVQVQGTFDTTGTKKIYFQFILDPMEKIKDWKYKWLWYKEGVRHFNVYFDTETLMIRSTNFRYGEDKRLWEKKASGEKKGKI